MSSSLAAIIVAAAPLFVALLAIRFDAEERATGARLAGLLLGLAGVVALMGIDVAGETQELLGALAILFSAFCYAVAPMVLKRHFADVGRRASMGAALAVAALALTPAMALDPPTEVPSGDAIFALLVLGLFCTAAAFVFYGASWPRPVRTGRWSSPTWRRSSRSASASRCWESGRARARSPGCC